MQSTELLDVVLGRNKDLLIQLRQQREKLERLSGRSHNRERGGEVEEILTRTDGDRGPARKALAKSTLRSAGKLFTQSVRALEASSVHIMLVGSFLKIIFFNEHRKYYTLVNECENNYSSFRLCTYIILHCEAQTFNWGYN